MAEDQEVLTKQQAAEFLQLDGRSVDYLVSTGQIPFSRLGKRSVRFKRSLLLAWLDERESVSYRLPRKVSK